MDGAFNHFNHLINKARKLFGRGNYQTRFPDITVEYPDGSYKAVDNKFTGKNGKIDPWGKKGGSVNNNLQREDYEDINHQQCKGSDEPKVDENDCDCEGRGKPQPVEVPMPSIVPLESLFFMGYPESLPAGRVPIGAPVRTPIRIPIRIPFPVFP